MTPVFVCLFRLSPLSSLGCVFYVLVCRRESVCKPISLSFVPSLLFVRLSLLLCFFFLLPFVICRPPRPTHPQTRQQGEMFVSAQLFFSTETCESETYVRASLAATEQALFTYPNPSQPIPTHPPRPPRHTHTTPKPPRTAGLHALNINRVREPSRKNVSMVALEATPACSGGGGGGHQRKGAAAPGRGRGGGGTSSGTGESQQRGEGSEGHRPMPPPASRSTLQLGKVGGRAGGRRS